MYILYISKKFNQIQFLIIYKIYSFYWHISSSDEFFKFFKLCKNIASKNFIDILCITKIKSIQSIFTVLII